MRIEGWNDIVLGVLARAGWWNPCAQRGREGSGSRHFEALVGRRRVWLLLRVRFPVHRSLTRLLAQLRLNSAAAIADPAMSGGGVIRGPAGNNDCRIYVGNLPPDIRTKDIEDVFYKYGAIRDIDLPVRCGWAAAHSPFSCRDAEDAVYGRDGYDYDGYRLRVEFPRSGRGTGRGGGGGGGGGAPRGRYGPPSRRSEYRVIVSGLPPSGSWQDLKDHMREAGDVCYADVFRDGTGVVEFVRKEDMTYAVRKLDNTKFRSHEGETAYIRVKVDGPRSPSYGRSRSRSVVVAEAVVEATAEAAVIPQEEAEDLLATLPVTADPVLVHK
nr:LOW QUALITY PROTEIN: serine/arginine-rich splicing factor 1 [Pelodiscus sinensis]|eukprot:XP_006138677.2 LOW QUALITY PROTEIN: serine/arginine-rich splicing factor 1 [Pelodiscus sinensis]